MMLAIMVLKLRALSLTMAARASGCDATVPVLGLSRSSRRSSTSTSSFCVSTLPVLLVFLRRDGTTSHMRVQVALRRVLQNQLRLSSGVAAAATEATTGRAGFAGLAD